MNIITCRTKSAPGQTPGKPRSLNKAITYEGSHHVQKEHITSIFLFASVKRSDTNAKPVMLRVVACSEREARCQLAQEYVLSLAARLPVKGVCNA